MDARSAERLPLALPIAYAIQLDDRQITGSTKTINISGGGVQLSISKKIDAPNAPLPCQITLKIPDCRPLTLQGQIMWCRPSPGQRTRTMKAGVAFTPSRYDEETFSSYCHFIATRLFSRYFRPLRRS